MHGPINVKSPNNTSKWQMGFNSAFNGLNSKSRRFTLQTGNEKQRSGYCLNRRRIKICNHATEFRQNNTAWVGKTIRTWCHLTTTNYCMISLYINMVPRPGKSGAIPLLPLYVFMTWTGITTNVSTAGVAGIMICFSVSCCIICSFRRVRGTNPQYHFTIYLHCLLWPEHNAVSELSRYVPRELRGIRSWSEVYRKHMGNRIQKTSRLHTSFVPLILPMWL
jgi:hypothetical protein